ncbi:hypothetical protein Hanom_Chr04g00316721 [Helianthus anomalus]
MLVLPLQEGNRKNRKRRKLQIGHASNNILKPTNHGVFLVNGAEAKLLNSRSSSRLSASISSSFSSKAAFSETIFLLFDTRRIRFS